MNDVFITEKSGKRRRAKHIVCEYCGKDHIVRINKRNTYKFCSLICANKSRNNTNKVVTEKKCCFCKQMLPISQFKSNKHHSNGLQGQCITCQKTYRKIHYEKNKQKYIAKAAKLNQEFKTWWKEYKKQFSCSVCGENHPACIHFHHHEDNKTDNVSSLVQGGCKQKILLEISKCTILCANCHAKIHWKD